MARDSYDVADALRNLVVDFHIFLVRLVDGGHPLPRARVVLTLDRVVPDLARAQSSARRSLIIPAFNHAPTLHRTPSDVQK
jgi:hypothetical protein